MPIGTARTIGYRPKPRALWTSREAFFTDAGLFVIGAAGLFSANVIGALPGDEVLLLPVLPILLLSRGSRAFDRQYLWFYVLILGWLLGTVIADFHVGSPAVSRVKGIARVVFLALDFMALAILINHKTRRTVIFALSIVTVFLGYVLQFRGEFLIQWKFGGASALILLSLFVSSYYYARRRYRICVAIALVLAGLNLKYAFRSQVAVVLVSTVLMLPIFAEPGDLRGGRPSAARNSLRNILLLALACGSAYLANHAIQFAAERGLFEYDLAQKFETQSQGKLGVLFGGRPETLVAIQAIRDNPIIGHGSFAVDPKYLELEQDIQYEYGYTDTDTPEDVYPSIPTHSHLTMAWVESGILGGAFWIYILVLTIRAILRISLLRPTLAPLYCYLLVNFVWDVLYSPFGSVNRIWAAYVILISYDLLSTPAIMPLPAVQKPKYLRPRRITLKRYLAS